MRGALQEIESKSYGLPEPVEIRLQQDQREEAPIVAARRTKPAWWLLYAMLPLTVFLFGLADGVATSGWRSVLELLATLVVFLGIGLWLHLNRLALVHADYAEPRDCPISRH